MNPPISQECLNTEVAPSPRFVYLLWDEFYEDHLRLIGVFSSVEACESLLKSADPFEAKSPFAHSEDEGYLQESFCLYRVPAGKVHTYHDLTGKLEREWVRDRLDAHSPWTLSCPALNEELYAHHHG